MINMNPILYQYICTTSSNLITLPLDIAQTKVIASHNTTFNVNELKWLALFPLIFTSQNIVYNNLFNIKNIFLRGAAAGIITTPIYTYLETSKINSRINQLPNYNIFIFLILLRQAIFYSVLYQISVFNIPNATFIAALVANLIGFPIKLYTLIKSYSVFVVNKKTIIISAIIEIFKASISDGSSLFLMYTPSFSPLKKIY